MEGGWNAVGRARREGEGWRVARAARQLSFQRVHAAPFDGAPANPSGEGRRVWKILRTAACGMMSLAVAIPARAQASDDTEENPWFVGSSLGLPWFADQRPVHFFTLSVHWTQVRASRPGVDLFVGTMPRVIAGGGNFPMLGRFGVTLPVALPEGLMLLPSVGVTLLAAGGTFGTEGSAGYNAGLAAMLPSTGRFRLRGGVSWHALGGSDFRVWLWELGVMRGPQPWADARRH